MRGGAGVNENSGSQGGYGQLLQCIRDQEQ